MIHYRNMLLEPSITHKYALRQIKGILKINDDSKDILIDPVISEGKMCYPEAVDIGFVKEKLQKKGIKSFTYPELFDFLSKFYGKKDFSKKPPKIHWWQPWKKGYWAFPRITGIKKPGWGSHFIWGIVGALISAGTTITLFIIFGPK